MSCNGCRVLRKGCSESCILRPCLTAVEGADAQGHATLFLAKFFGRAGLMGFIANVSELQRPALFQSLLFEACGRTINPVYGSAGLLWSGSWHLCEAAVDAVLRGNTLQPVPSTLLPVQAPATPPPPPPPPAPSKSPEVAFHAPPQPSRQQMPDMDSRQGHAAPSLSFHMTEPPTSTTSYWPHTMAPTVGAHMAAMEGAAYPLTHSTGASHYLHNNASIATTPQLHEQQQRQQGQYGSHPWSSQDTSQGQGGQQYVQETQGFQRGLASPSGKSSSKVCSPIHLPSAPLVTPVARRLTPRSGPFMPSVSSEQGGVLTLGSKGHSSACVVGEEFGRSMPDCGGRSSAEPPTSHSLLPLIPCRSA